MLASQLCVFDDKADSISKWVEDLIVWLCYLDLVWKDFVICDALFQFNDDACKVNVSCLNSKTGIRTI